MKLELKVKKNIDASNTVPTQVTHYDAQTLNLAPLSYAKTDVPVELGTFINWNVSATRDAASTLDHEEGCEHGRMP